MQERSLLEYWLILYERRVAIYVVIATALVAALAIGYFVTPVYEARASLYIPAKLAQVSYMAGGSTSSLARDQGAPLSKEGEYKPYMGMLKSAQLAKIVSDQYPTKSVAKLLRSDVDFEVTDELIVRVYSRDPDPKLAADVANAYVEGLNKILADNSLAQVGQEPAYIDNALTRLNDAIRKAEAELQVFEKRNYVANLDAELIALSNQKTAQQTRADDTLVQITAVRSSKAALSQEIKREGEDLAASEVALTSPVIDGLRTQLAEALARYSELDSELGGKNIQLLGQRQRVHDLERQLSNEIKRWFASRIKPTNTHVEQLRQRYIDLLIEEQRLEAVSRANVQALARLNQRLGSYPEIRARNAALRSNLERLQRMRDQLQINQMEANLQNERKMQMVVVLDQAQPPTRPAFPIWWLNGSVALIAGALAGIGYAFFLNYLERTRNVRILRVVRAVLDRRT